MDLFTKQIDDKYIRENFDKIEQAYNDLAFTLGDFKFFEFKIDGAQTDFKLYHKLNFYPNDVIVTKAIGSAFEFDYEKFTDEYLTIRTTGDLYLRMFIGNMRGDEVTGSTAFASITDDLGGTGGAGGGSSDSMTYKGAYNASGPDSQLNNAWKGDFYIISTGGTAFGKSWDVGDHLIVNTDVTGTPTSGQIDKVDNTESPDLLRNGDVVNDLATGGTDVPLSAQQGLVLKGLIDNIVSDINDPEHHPWRKITVSAPASSPIIVDQLAVGIFNTAEYTINITNSTSNLTRTMKMLVHNQNGIISDTVYGRIGQGLNIAVSAVNTAGNMQLIVTNNEVNAIDVKVARLYT